jgi:hypothetical protein
MPHPDAVPLAFPRTFDMVVSCANWLNLLKASTAPHFPLFCSKNNTCLFTTGSYLSILNGLLVLGLEYVLKNPVMAMLIRRTAIVRVFARTQSARAAAASRKNVVEDRVVLKTARTTDE